MVNHADGKLIGGYTTKDHLLLDLDHCWRSKAEKVARMIMREYPEVGCCLLVQSSNEGFHLVFSRKMAWSRICHVSKVLASLGTLNRDYIRIREFRHDLTLRVTPIDRGQGVQPQPKVLDIIHAGSCGGRLCCGSGRFRRFLELLVGDEVLHLRCLHPEVREPSAEVVDG